MKLGWLNTNCSAKKMGKRYLYGMHLDYAIRNGKTVEQFLGGFCHGEDKAIRYLTIRKQGEEFWLHNHEVYDEGNADYLDLYAFEYVGIPDDRFEPFPIKFNSMEDALSYATSEFGAKPEGWVNKGVAQDEYGDFIKAQNRA